MSADLPVQPISPSIIYNDSTALFDEMRIMAVRQVSYSKASVQPTSGPRCKCIYRCSWRAAFCEDKMWKQLLSRLEEMRTAGACY